MHLAGPFAVVLAALTTVTAAAPSLGGAAQQVVGAVQEAGQHAASHAKEVLSEERPWAWQSVKDEHSKKYKFDKKKHKKNKKHKGREVTSAFVRNRLKKADIIPSVMDDFVPSFLLNISFPHKQGPFLGQTLKPSDLQQAPHVNLYAPPHRPSPPTSDISVVLNNLVVIMTDPDAPSRKNATWGEICHWIAVGLPVNVPPGNSGDHLVLKEIMPYKPPGPPPKTGKHRYVLLAFTPANATSVPLDLVMPSDRKHWGYGERGAGVKRWAHEMGLLPIAGDYFKSKYRK